MRQDGVTQTYHVSNGTAFPAPVILDHAKRKQ